MKCIKCNKKAIGRLSPDLDINGIGFCKKHEWEVKMAYFALMQGDEKKFRDLLKIKKEL